MSLYSFNDLVALYRHFGIKKGDIVSLKTDLTRLGMYENPDKKSILEDHVRALDSVLDFDHGTVVVATSTTNLCNTDIPYDPIHSASMVGVLTEYIRKQAGATRSYHAFESYAALGKHADALCRNVSRYSYGLDTPEDRLVISGAKCIALGVEAKRCCSTVHHMEILSAVPYRYVKEFEHPVQLKDRITDRFFRHVWYLESDIEKNTDRLFAKMRASGFKMSTATIGHSYAQCYLMSDLLCHGMAALRQDPYICLAYEPRRKCWI